MKITKYEIRNTKYDLSNPKLLAGVIIVLSGVLVWRTQYYVDYEVSLLPWLAGRRWSLYSDVVDQHPPLLTWLLSLLGGGDPGWPLQAVIVGLHLLTMWLVYAVAARLAGSIAGVVALLLAMVWLVPFEATHLWFDGALGLVYLGILASAERVVKPANTGATDGSGESWRRSLPSGAWTLIVGLLLGTGVIIKQHALVLIPFALVWVWQSGITGRRKRFALFGAGVASPILAAIAALALQGTLSEAWYWVVSYSLTSDYSQAASLTPGVGEWITLVALYAPILALILALFYSRRSRTHPPTWALLGGALLAATLPAWPRYGRFHLQGAIPLIAVAGGVGVVWLLGEGLHRGAEGSMRRWALGLGLLVVAMSGVIGARQWARGLFVYGQVGSPQAPYASTIEPLRGWVDTNAEPGAPVFIYNLDSLLYRALEREPTRPFVPQLSWVLSSGESEARLWNGVSSARPPIALAPAGWWDDAGSLGAMEREGILRRDYHEGARFAMVSYPGARRVDVVGLVRDDGARR